MAARQFLVPGNHATVRGLAAPGATASLYTTGTTTPQPFYTTDTLSVSLGTTITADAIGEFPEAYQDASTPFRLIIKSKSGVVLDGGDIDPFYFGQTLIAAGGTSSFTTRTLMAASAASTGANAILTESGREGTFVYSASDLSAYVTADTAQGLYVAPASDTTGASGAWVRKFSGPADFRWFGAVADCTAVGSGTTNTAAFNAAITALVAAKRGWLHIPQQAAAYRFATAPAAIHDRIMISGDGYSNNPGQVGATVYTGVAIWNGTVLCFDADIAGLTFYGYTDNAADATAYEFQSAVGSTVKDLLLHGGLGNGITAHGIYARIAINIDNVMCYQFAGCGFKIEAYDSTSNPYGSFDTSHIKKLVCRTNRLHGVQVVGRDANSNTFTSLDVSANGGVGLLEQSLLGNTYIGPHASGNNYSHPTNGGTTSVAQRNQVVADCADLSDNLLGSYVCKDPNATNVFVGPYIEQGQGARYIIATPSMIIGGNAASNNTAFRSSVSGNGGVVSYSSSGLDLINVDHLYSIGTTTSPTSTITAVAGTFSVRGYNAYSTISVVSDGASQGLQLYNSTNGLKDGLDILTTADQTNYGCQQHFFRQGTGYGSTVYFSHNGSHFNLASGDFQVAGTQVINSSGRLQAVGMPALTGDVTTAGGALAATIAANAVTYAKFQQVAASSLVGNATGSLANATGITLGNGLAFSGSALQMSADAVSGAYQTLFQASGSHTAAQVAGTYAFPMGEALVVSGTGSLYPVAIIYLDTNDHPAIGTLSAKLRLRCQLAVNDVAPTGNFTVGLYPVTRPGTSGGAGVAIYTLGTVVSGSTAVVNTPAADSHTNMVGSDFAVPSSGFYCIGVVTTATVAASSHLHLSAQLQKHYA